MIEIIPNSHPIFVHFTIALFTVSVIFYILSYLQGKLRGKSNSTAIEFETVARWCLWVAGLATIFTATAGLYAYFTIAHDADSHIAMTIHRNWALPTAILIVASALWSCWKYYKNKSHGAGFIISLILILGLLSITAWHGAELVYRYGAGVIPVTKNIDTGHHQSKPSISDEHKNHQH